MKVLGIAPCFDKATEYSYKWYEELMKKVKPKIKLKELKKEEATRKNFNQIVSTEAFDAIVFYDHGEKDGLVAQGGKEYILDTKNLSKVAAKVIYTMACLSAKKLGVDAYKKGIVYVGYIEVFAFTTYDEHLFCQAANSGFIAYAKGERNWKKIKQIMIEAFNKAIELADDPWTKIWLRWDRDALRVYDGESPKSYCPLRKVALKILGPEIGWKLTKTLVGGMFFYLVGFGITLHAIASELYYKGGYLEILSPQGEWIGLALNFVGFLLILRGVKRLLRK